MNENDKKSETFRKALEDSYRVTPSSEFTAEVKRRMGQPRRTPALALLGAGTIAAALIAVALPGGAPEPADEFIARGNTDGRFSKRVGMELYLYPSDGGRRRLSDGNEIPKDARLALRVVNRSNSPVEARLTLSDAKGKAHPALPPNEEDESMTVAPHSSTDIRDGGFRIEDFPVGPMTVDLSLRGGDESLILSMPLRVVE
ncbi:MAG: hypothetical protein AAF654_13165 [Myxococcota bacterium]